MEEKEKQKQKTIFFSNKNIKNSLTFCYINHLKIQNYDILATHALKDNRKTLSS